MRTSRLNLVLAVLLLGLAAPSVWAAGASQIIGGLAVLHIESTVDGQRDLCARRFRDSAADWQTAVTGWKQRQATALATVYDDPGVALCADWRAGLAVGGPMEQNLPRAIEAARKLLPAVR
jgi:hypothetical protein